MKKLISLCIAAIMVLCCFAACNTAVKPTETGQPGNPVPDTDPVAQDFISQERFLELTGLAEEDIEDIVYDDFVAEYELTEEKAAEYKQADLAATVDAYREYHRITYQDFGYLYDNALEGDKLTKADFPKIKRVMYNYLEGYCHGLLIDVETNKSYPGIHCAGMLKYYDGVLVEPERAYEWGAAHTESLVELLEASGIENWETSYFGENEEGVKWQMNIAFELSDGRIILYMDRGSLSGAPKEMRELADKLYDLATSAVE